jgi:hypothetical protein
LAALGRYDEAVAGYDQMIAALPENFEAHRGRGFRRSRNSRRRS